MIGYCLIGQGKVVFVNETPANCIYFGSDDDDVYIIAELFKEWKEYVRE